MLEMSALKLFTVAYLRYQLSLLLRYTLPPTRHHCFFRNLPPSLFCQLRDEQSEYSLYLDILTDQLSIALSQV